MQKFIVIGFISYLTALILIFAINSVFTKIDYDHNKRQIALYQSEIDYNSQLLNDMKETLHDLRQKQNNFDKDDMDILMRTIDDRIFDIQSEIMLLKSYIELTNKRIEKYP